jgi:hypothetical protein
MKSWNILGEGLRLESRPQRIPSKASKEASNNKGLRRRMCYREECCCSSKGCDLGWLVDIYRAKNKMANGLSLLMRSRRFRHRLQKKIAHLRFLHRSFVRGGSQHRRMTDNNPRKNLKWSDIISLSPRSLDLRQKHIVSHIYDLLSVITSK